MTRRLGQKNWSRMRITARVKREPAVGRKPVNRPGGIGATPSG
jgi:hypothetical protein